MRKTVVFVIIIQLFIIVLLSFSLFTRQTVTKTYSVGTMSKNGFVFSKNNNLMHFYEPKLNTVITTDLRFLGEIHTDKITYTYNNDSLHQIKDIFVEKSFDTYRIITLGDSFTFGSNLNTKDTYPSQLESILNELQCKNIRKFEVLNLGVPGYDIQYALERYKIRGEKYNADTILWFLIEDDMVRINELMLPKTRIYGKEMRENGEYENFEKNGVFYPDYKKARADVITELGEENILHLQKKYLEDIKKYNDQKIVLFTFPFTKDSYKEIMRSSTSSTKNVYFYDQLINIYEEDGAFPDSHPNTKGAKLIAQDIATYLNEKKLIPCN